MFCIKCGKEINSGIRFCPSCGTPVSGSSTPADKEMPFINNADMTVKNDNAVKASRTSKNANKVLVAVIIVLLICIVGVFITFSIIYNKRKNTSAEEFINDPATESSDPIKTADDTAKTGDTEYSYNQNDQENEENKEQKYLDEAEKYLAQDDPLSAAEVLTAALQEEYYPAVYDELEDIRKRTMDYRTVTEYNSSDSDGEHTEFKESTDRQYENGILIYEEDNRLSDGNTREFSSYDKYELDDDGHKIIKTKIGNLGEEITVQENDESGHKLVEHADSINGKIRKITYYDEEGNETRIEFYDTIITQEMSEERIFEYDDRGNKVKQTNNHFGWDQISPGYTETYTYKYDEYDRLKETEMDLLNYTGRDTYEYAPKGYSVHGERNRKEDADSLDSYLKSISDTEYDSLGGMISMRNVNTYDSDEGTTEKTYTYTYTHDYHYYDGDYEMKSENSANAWTEVFLTEVGKIKTRHEADIDNMSFDIVDIDGDKVPELISFDREGRFAEISIYKSGDVVTQKLFDNNDNPEGFTDYGAYASIQSSKNQIIKKEYDSTYEKNGGLNKPGTELMDPDGRAYEAYEYLTVYKINDDKDLTETDRYSVHYHYNEMGPEYDPYNDYQEPVFVEADHNGKSMSEAEYMEIRDSAWESDVYFGSAQDAGDGLSIEQVVKMLRGEPTGLRE